MLSYMFLSDHPCGEKSWSPSDDSTQWRCRRDALCRMAIMSLWQSAHSKHTATSDCTFVFSDRNLDDGIDPAVLITDSEIALTMKWPTERKLVTEWKNAVQFSTRNPSKALLKSTLVHQHHMKTSDYCKANFTPWLESSMRSQAIATHAEGVIDKREMVNILQQKCTLDFLRQHRLNGPPDLVLKKRNKSEISAAYFEWQKSSQHAAMISEDDNSGFSKLKHTFIALLDRVGAGATVLLLHEDYPIELPVFGMIQDRNNMDSMLSKKDSYHSANFFGKKGQGK